MILLIGKTPVHSQVTAIGRLLKPKNGEPRIHKIIAVRADGTVKTVVNKPMQ